MSRMQNGKRMNSSTNGAGKLDNHMQKKVKVDLNVMPNQLKMD